MPKIKRSKDICKKCGLLRCARKSNRSYPTFSSKKYGLWDKCSIDEAEIIVCGYTGMVLFFKEKGFKINPKAMEQCKMHLEQIVHQEK